MAKCDKQVWRSDALSSTLIFYWSLDVVALTDTWHSTSDAAPGSLCRPGCKYRCYLSQTSEKFLNSTAVLEHVRGEWTFPRMVSTDSAKQYSVNLPGGMISDGHKLFILSLTLTKFPTKK